MKKSSLILSLALSLSPICAQEKPATPKNTTTTSAVSPAIELSTSDPMIAASFHAGNAAEGAGELPELAADHHFAFVLNSDGKLSTETKPGDSGYLKMTLYPNAMVELYKEQIDESWEIIRDSAALGLTQMGMSAKQAAIMMRAVRVFPEQLQTVHIAVSQNPEFEISGMRVHVQVVPTKGMWLGKFVAKLRPSSQGAPVVPSKGAMVAIAASVDTSEIGEFVAPLFEIISGLGARNKKERTANLGMINKLFEAFDGTFSSAGDPFGGVTRGVGGLRDPAAVTSVMASEEYAKYTEATSRLGAMVDAEVEQNAFKHRDIPVMKTIITSDTETPVMPTGEQTTYTAVAGSYLISATTVKIENVKSLMDQALDQKVKRKPLAGNALAIVNVQFMDLIDRISPIGNPFEGQEKLPETLRISVDAKGGSLNLRISID